MCEAVGTDGTGHTVKLGQAAQAKEETFEARQHLQLPLILAPILFVKSSGWRGGEAAWSQGTLFPMLFPLPPSNPPHPVSMAAWPHCITLWVLQAPHPPATMLALFDTVGMSPGQGGLLPHSRTPAEPCCSQGTSS